MLLVVGGLFCVGASGLFGQSKRSSAPSGQTAASSPTFAVKSNLVLVPVFIYDRARMAQAPKQELPCVRATVAAFYELGPTRPYLPKDCDATQIRGLKLKDFRLFQGREQQRITKITAGGWWTVARDNLGWYMQSSLTPSGIWGSANLSHLHLVPPGINRDLYILSYVPSTSKPGCHRIKVEVDRPDALVLARERYCTGQTASDPLVGTNRGKALKRILASQKRGKIPLSLQAVAFDAAGNQSRVDICLRFPWKDLYRSWDLSAWTLRARIALMGVVRGKDGTVAARFSDLLYPSYWPTFVQGGAKYRSWETGSTKLAGAIPSEVAGKFSTSTLGSDNHGDTLAQIFRVAAGEIRPNYAAIKLLLNSSDPAWIPTRYETQVELPPGNYTLQVVLSDGWKFGRAEMPLTIEPYNGKQLTLSSVALCKQLRDARVATEEDAKANFAPRYVPLVSKNIEFTPAGDTRFEGTEPLFAYFEVYEPLFTEGQAASVEIHLRILDERTGKVLSRFAPVNAAPYKSSGSSVLRIAREVPFRQLPKGNYVLEVRATDSVGESTGWRKADFTVQ